LTLSPPREISRTAVNQLALPYRCLYFVNGREIEDNYSSNPCARV
jgi:hypothetical protein